MPVAKTTAAQALTDLLFERAGAGLCLVAPDGAVVRTNAEWLRSMGFTGEVVGESIVELFPATSDMALALARARAGHRVEVPRHSQVVNRRETWWEGSIEPVPMEGGTGLLFVAREASRPDVPARDLDTRIADYLRDVGPAGIVLFEPTPPFRVLSANKAYEEWWPEPLRTRGLAGLALTDYIPDAEEAGVAEVFRDVATTRTTRHLYEFPYALADGTHWFSWTLAPVVRDGDVVALANMAVDVTREVTARKEAEHARDESRHAAEILELGDAFCELDSEFRIVRVNARQEQLTGLPRAESLGKTHWELWPASARPDSPWWREYHRCMQERVEVAFEDYYAPLDLWSSVTAYPTSSGGIAIFFRDVSMRKRTEEALRASEERLRSVLENMSEGLVLFDTEGSITYQNPASVRIHDRRVSGERGRFDQLAVNWRVRTFPEGVVVPPEQWAIPRVLRGERVQGERFYVDCVEDAERSFVGIYSGCPIYDPGGRLAYGFLTIQEITDHARAHEALRHLNETLREADSRKDEFLGMLSHELRNPLAPIRNSTYVLQHAAPGSEQARRAQTVIQRQTEHLTRLVDDLLDVTRIARGKIELRRERVDLRAVVLHAGDDFRLAMQDRGVSFRTSMPDAEVWADADPTRIAQVVGNLLHNAAKFTRRGDEVTLSLETAGSEAVIRVRDTGAGIAPALLPRVFEPFVQGERTLARTEGGLGLGLALVKGVAELHAGSVRAESAGKGKGAEFIVRLPLVAPSPVERGAVARAGRGTVGRRVLVVDDNADAAESLADIVGMLGHAVEVAYDGVSAVEKARANPPDIVLCDIGLPGMSGYEVARALREMGNVVQLFAVSGYARAEDVRKAIEAGFDGHIAKPPKVEDIERLLA